MPCSESGNRQAIRLLRGEVNPNPSLYEVESYFDVGAVLDGNETRRRNTESCPIGIEGHISLSPNKLALDIGESTTLSVNSSHAWTVGDIPDHITLTPTSGEAGVHTIRITALAIASVAKISFINTTSTDTADLQVETLVLPTYGKQPIQTRWMEIDLNKVMNGESYNIWSKNWDTGLANDFSLGGWNGGTYRTRVIGEYEWMLENWKMAYNTDRAYGLYKVTDELLTQSGVPMSKQQSEELNGCYAFAGQATDRYLNGLAVYTENPQPMGMNANLFSEATVSNLNIKNVGGTNTIVKDANTLSFFVDNLPPQQAYTMTRAAATNEFKIHTFWGAIAEGNNQYIATTDAGTNNSLTAKIGNYSISMLFVVSSNGTAFDALPNIKIEKGNTFTGWITPQEPIQGWDMADRAAFEQLFGMVGRDLSPNNLLNHLFVSPSDADLPWLKSWLTADKCNDLLGVRLLPTGHKQNLQAANVAGNIIQFGERVAFGLRSNMLIKDDIGPAIWINVAKSAKDNQQIVFDTTSNMPASTSIKAWQRNYRFCRPLTDAELGYKLWRDDANDRILVTSLNQTTPQGTSELPKGLLRGLAVRWLNPTKTEVIAPLSKLLEEVAQTANDGAYKWYGWH
jgi:hypothetical protein